MARGYNCHLKGLTVCQRYLNNAKVLGSDALVELNEKLGIVNFGSYTQDTLNAMLDILRSDTHRRDVEVVVRGKDSDYNAALTQNTIDNDFKKTLFFEVGGDYSLESVRDLLDMHGISIRQLTFEGHGGERGLRLCSRFGLDRNKEKIKKLPGLRDLMDRIMPDRFGNKNIILHSCSQGRRYDRHGSTAEMLVDIASPDVVVEAAPRAMFARKTGREGELQFVTNRYHETAEILKKYDRYPGVSKLVTWLNHEDRRKAGTLKVSRNGTTKNRDGIVRIGA